VLRMFARGTRQADAEPDDLACTIFGDEQYPPAVQIVDQCEIVMPPRERLLVDAERARPLPPCAGTVRG
jgi:hypothetical protein